MSKSYEKPQIKTLPADQIVESMGPVSCGSGAPASMPTGGNIGVTGGSTPGNRNPR